MSPSPINILSGRQRLTASNLAIHDARQVASPQGPTPMQRWFLGEEDTRVGHETRTGGGETRRAHDAMAAEIEKLIEDIRKTRDGKCW